MSQADDLATRYMPDGVEVDDANRHAAGQLAIAWLALAPEHRRLVVEYERVLSPEETAAVLRRSAGRKITTREAAALLDTAPIRRVLHLRSLMREETIPPAMIGRVLSRIALGIEDDATPFAKIRACVELARVQGAYVPPQQGADRVDDGTGLEQLDQAAKDRIVAGAMWPGGAAAEGQTFADMLRARVTASDAEGEAAKIEAEEAAAEQSVAREEAAAAPKAKPHKFKRRPEGFPVIGTIPPHLANTDALEEARRKMAGGGGG